MPQQKQGQEQNKLLREEERKENSGIGEWMYIYTSQTSRPQQDKYTLTHNSQVTRRFYPNSALPITAKQDTRIGNHAMGQQGISENRKDAYGLTIALRKRLGSVSPIPFCRMHRVEIGGQGFQDIGGSRSCPDAGTRHMPTLASALSHEEIRLSIVQLGLNIHDIGSLIIVGVSDTE